MQTLRLASVNPPTQIHSYTTNMESWPSIYRASYELIDHLHSLRLVSGYVHTVRWEGLCWENVTCHLNNNSDYGVMVSITALQAADLGSIPDGRNFFLKKKERKEGRKEERKKGVSQYCIKSRVLKHTITLVKEVICSLQPIAT